MNYYAFIAEYQDELGQDFHQLFTVPILLIEPTEEEQKEMSKEIMYLLMAGGYKNFVLTLYNFKKIPSFEELEAYVYGKPTMKEIEYFMKTYVKDWRFVLDEKSKHLKPIMRWQKLKKPYKPTCFRNVKKC